MPKSPDGKPSGTSTGDPTAQLLIKMAESSQLLTEAVASLATSQASFMRSAADADANIGISKSHPFLPSELFDIRLIDNTVDDKTAMAYQPPRETPHRLRLPTTFPTLGLAATILATLATPTLTV